MVNLFIFRYAWHGFGSLIRSPDEVDIEAPDEVDRMESFVGSGCRLHVCADISAAPDKAPLPDRF